MSLRYKKYLAVFPIYTIRETQFRPFYKKWFIVFLNKVIQFSWRVLYGPIVRILGPGGYPTRSPYEYQEHDTFIY